MVDICIANITCIKTGVKWRSIFHMELGRLNRFFTYNSPIFPPIRVMFMSPIHTLAIIHKNRGTELNTSILIPPHSERRSSNVTQVSHTFNSSRYLYECPFTKTPWLNIKSLDPLPIAFENTEVTCYKLINFLKATNLITQI